MRYELFIGLRYLRAKRKEAFISLITVFSIVGVFMGVMTLTIVLAVMTGLEEDLRDRILGFTPHVLVLSHSGAMKDNPAVIEEVRAVPGVLRVMPFVYGQAMLSTQQNLGGVLVRGIPPNVEVAVDVTRHVAAADLERLQQRQAVPLNDGRGDTVELPSIIIGEELARQLNVQVGEVVSIISPLGTPSALGMVPRVKRFVVVATFSSGMSEYDSQLAYMSMNEAQKFFQMGDNITGLEVRVDDLYAARRIGEKIAARLDFPYLVRDWVDMNFNLFRALKLEKWVYFIVLLMIVLVAAFNIVATLIMVVMEKRKDIAILKSMGATASGIARIFVFKGLIIGMAGTVLGNIGGLTACWALATFKFIDLPKGVFYTDKLPVKIYPEYFAIVTLASVLMCLLATVYPARKAARLAPVDVIRYE